MMRRLTYLYVPLLTLAVWYGVTRFGSIPPILLPSPEAVWNAFCRSASDGTLVHNILASAGRSMIGFGLSAFLGILLGVSFACCSCLHRLGYVAVETIRVTPPLALIPLLILWLGIDEAPKIAIVFLSSFFPVYMNAFTAVRTIDPKLEELAKLLHFSSLEKFRYLIFPGALPGVLTGLRLGFGYSWRALVGAELIAASSGLGFLISESAEFAKTDMVFVGIITIAVLGIAADNLLQGAVRLVMRHRGGAHV